MLRRWHDTGIPYEGGRHLPNNIRSTLKKGEKDSKRTQFQQKFSVSFLNKRHDFKQDSYFDIISTDQAKELLRVDRSEGLRPTTATSPRYATPTRGHFTIHHFQTSYYQNWVRVSTSQVFWSTDDWLKFRTNGHHSLASFRHLYIIRPPIVDPRSMSCVRVYVYRCEWPVSIMRVHH